MVQSSSSSVDSTLIHVWSGFGLIQRGTCCGTKFDQKCIKTCPGLKEKKKLKDQVAYAAVKATHGGTHPRQLNYATVKAAHGGKHPCLLAARLAAQAKRDAKFADVTTSDDQEPFITAAEFEKLK